MANFERLIKGALASQDASSEEVRQVIYQSSRNALQKIIDSNRSLTLEAVMQQKQQLEASIAEIEAEYNAPVVEPGLERPNTAPPIIQEPRVEVEAQPQPETLANPVVINEQPEEFIAPPQPEPQQEPVIAKVPDAVQVKAEDPLHEIQQILESTNPQAFEPDRVQPVQAAASAPERIEPQVEQQQHVQPEPMQPQAVVVPEPTMQSDIDPVNLEAPAAAPQSAVQSEYYEEQENMPLGFSKRRKTQKRLLWTLVILVLLGLLAWIAYIAVVGMLNGDLLGQNDNNGPKLNPNSISRQANSENYITVIDASDLSSLNTSGSGKAQIVNQLNSNMIRINSVRDALNRAEPASPILINLKPGVLKQISGKRVTVEIFAKSGGDESAHFAIGCEFAGLTECGRKRFLAGSQPNASVFAFQMDQVSDINQPMYFTLSTDTTSQAAVTGKGDILDIVYIRLSVDN